MPSRRPHAHRNTVATILATTTVAVATIWLSALTLAWQDSQSVLRDARTELLGAQNAISSQMVQTFENAHTLARAVDLWLEEGNGRRSLDELVPWMAALQHSHEAPLTPRLFDAEGVAVRYGAAPPTQVDASDRDFIRELADAQPGTTYIGEQIDARPSGRTVIPLALKARPNAFGIAYIVPAIPTSTFVDAFESLLITAPNVVGLVRGDGTVLFRTRGPVGERIDLDALLGGRPASEIPRVGILEHPHPRTGSAVLTAYARLPPPRGPRRRAGAEADPGEPGEKRHPLLPARGSCRGRLGAFARRRRDRRRR